MPTLNSFKSQVGKVKDCRELDNMYKSGDAGISFRFTSICPEGKVRLAALACYLLNWFIHGDIRCMIL